MVITFLASFLIWFMFFGLIILWFYDGKVTKEAVVHSLFSVGLTWVASELLKNIFHTLRPFELNGLKTLTYFNPIVAMRGSVVFPHTDTLLSFGRPKSIAAINTAFQEDKVVAIFCQKDPRLSDPGQEDLYEIGTIATITQMMSTEGEVHALVRGQ